MKTDETVEDGHWTDNFLVALLSALKLIFKMNFVHICLLNVKLRMSHVNYVTARCTFLYS